MKLETKFKESVRRDLKTLENVWFFKTQEVATRGIPDFILCLNGYFVTIELKRSKKIKLEPLQEHISNRIEEKGKGIALRAAPENWEKIFDLLKKLDAGKPQRRKVKTNLF